MTKEISRKDLERLAQAFEQGIDEMDRIQGRAIRAFTNVISWWEDEILRAREGDDPIGHFLSASAMMAFQIGAVLRSTLVGQAPEFKRRLLAHIIAHMEEETGLDLLPTRDEIAIFEKDSPRYVN